MSRIFSESDMEKKGKTSEYSIPIIVFFCLVKHLKPYLTLQMFFVLFLENRDGKKNTQLSDGSQTVLECGLLN